MTQDYRAYGFLGIPSSARIYGLGGMNISTVEDNLNVTDQNPALLGPEMGGWLDLNYMRYIGDSNFAGEALAGLLEIMVPGKPVYNISDTDRSKRLYPMDQLLDPFLLSTCH